MVCTYKALSFELAVNYPRREANYTGPVLSNETSFDNISIFFFLRLLLLRPTASMVIIYDF